MEVEVRARKAAFPDTVQAHAKAKVSKLGRLAPFLEHAEVRLVEASDVPGTNPVCEVTLQGHGHVLRARARAADAREAIDLVVEKLEHQTERLKGKLVGRSQPRRSRTLTGT